MIKEILNYFEYDNTLSAGGQPTVDQIKALKTGGVEVIVSISPENTRNYLPVEAEVVNDLKMKFFHYPIDCSNLQADHYLTFKQILQEHKGKKIFVHCGGNIKSSNLIHMYKVLELRVDEKDSLEELKKIQEPELKWINYFKEFGMMGLS